MCGLDMTWEILGVRRSVVTSKGSGGVEVADRKVRKNVGCGGGGIYGCELDDRR